MQNKPDLFGFVFPPAHTLTYCWYLSFFFPLKSGHIESYSNVTFLRSVNILDYVKFSVDILGLLFI